MVTKIPDDVVVWAFKSINGEVTQNMRMIALSYGRNEAKFRFYMDEEPKEAEEEIAEIIAVNFDSGISSNIDSLDIEFVVQMRR